MKTPTANTLGAIAVASALLITWLAWSDGYATGLDRGLTLGAKQEHSQMLANGEYWPR